MTVSKDAPSLRIRMRLFRRLLVSYNDFKKAADIAGVILSERLYAGPHATKRHLWEGLNCAMVIAYARPFSGNRQSEMMLPSLPARFLEHLSLQERGLHDIVMTDRNEALAHSDATAWNLRLSVIRTTKSSMLAPFHQNTQAPLEEEPTRMLHGMAIKLMEAVFSERQKLEPVLLSHLPILSLEDGSVSGSAEAMSYGGYSVSPNPAGAAV